MNLKMRLPKGRKRARIGAKFEDGDWILRDDLGLTKLYWADIPGYYIGEFIANDVVVRRIRR